VLLSEKKETKLCGLHVTFTSSTNSDTFMCMSLKECSSVADSASDGLFLHVSVSSRDKNVETKRCNDEKNKTTIPKRNYFYVSIISFWHKFIKHRYSENR
jgi:hypothetical protein